MTSISKIWIELTSILSNQNNFHSLEVVDRVSETQLQVGENSNGIIWRLKESEWFFHSPHKLLIVIDVCSEVLLSLNYISTREVSSPFILKVIIIRADSVFYVIYFLLFSNYYQWFTFAAYSQHSTAVEFMVVMLFTVYQLVVHYGGLLVANK